MIKNVINPTDLALALELVNRVFSEFVAVDYSERGKQTFRDYLKSKYDEVSQDLQTGHKQLWAYYQGDMIVGVIATRDVSHIALLFVDKAYHKQGIARQLFQFVLTEIKQHPDIRSITVNSSPYAVEAYERLGFVRAGEQQEQNGILFIPMAYAV